MTHRSVALLHHKLLLCPLEELKHTQMEYVTSFVFVLCIIVFQDMSGLGLFVKFF